MEYWFDPAYFSVGVFVNTDSEFLGGDVVAIGFDLGPFGLCLVLGGKA